MIGFVTTMRPDLVVAVVPAAVGPASPTAPAPGPAASVAAAAPAPSPAGTEDPVRDRILALVTAKTGYPPDMLDVDLDLEADLGVDTVKQAELFASVREEWGIPRDESRRLRDYPTLRHVIGFVRQMRPDLDATAAPAVTPSPSALPSPTTPAPAPAPPFSTAVAAGGTDPVADTILALVTEKTGYPPDMLDLDLDLEADLGVDTVKQAELFASVRKVWDIPRDDNRKLRDYPTLRHVIDFVHEMRPDLRPSALPVTAPAPTPGEPVVEAAAAAAHAVETAPAPAAAPLDAADRVPRRVVVPVMRPPLALCKATGVPLEQGPTRGGDRGPWGRGQGPRPPAREARGGRAGGRGAHPRPRPSSKQIERWLAEGPIHGVYWLPALDVEGDLTSLDLAPLARGFARPGQAALHDDARALRPGGGARHLPRRRHSPGWPARLRRVGRRRSPGRRRDAASPRPTSASGPRRW